VSRCRCLASRFRLIRVTIWNKITDRQRNVSPWGDLYAPFADGSSAGSAHRVYQLRTGRPGRPGQRSAPVVAHRSGFYGGRRHLGYRACNPAGPRRSAVNLASGRAGAGGRCCRHGGAVRVLPHPARAEHAGGGIVDCPPVLVSVAGVRTWIMWSWDPSWSLGPSPL
jgi:hypothetical protein